jgi:hypothetical protein
VKGYYWWVDFYPVVTVVAIPPMAGWQGTLGDWFACPQVEYLGAWISGDVRGGGISTVFSGYPGGSLSGHAGNRWTALIDPTPRPWKDKPPFPEPDYPKDYSYLGVAP